jgi:hypothetical protein
MKEINKQFQYGEHRKRQPPKSSIPGAPHGAAGTMTGGSAGHCSCGGQCPKCAAKTGSPTQRPENLGGSKSLAPAYSARPNPIIENFGRWASYETRRGPEFNSHGVDPFFLWAVDFKTSLQMGYLVQKITSTWVAHNCDDTPYTGWEPTPVYWERWKFYNGKNVTPKDTLTGADDRWQRGLANKPKGLDCGSPYLQATSGVWSITGELYVYPHFPLGGFSSTQSCYANAGNLEYSLTQPKEDLGRPMAKRTIAGSWDFCPPNDTHTRI